MTAGTLRSGAVLNGSSWRAVLKVHPAADMFPVMSPDEIKALAQDIDANGLMNKIVLTFDESPDGTTNPKAHRLVDGRNRLTAMEQLGWELFNKKGQLLSEFWTYCADYGGDDNDRVVSANLIRRHLTPEERRDLIAKLLKADPGKSDRQIAAAVKVDHKTVGAVRKAAEGRGEIPHVAKRTDTKGRAQSARKQSVKKKQPSAYIVHADGRREPFSVTDPVALYTACGMPINKPAEIAQALAEFKLAVDIWFGKMDAATRRAAVGYATSAAAEQ